MDKCKCNDKKMCDEHHAQWKELHERALAEHKARWAEKLAAETVKPEWDDMP